MRHTLATWQIGIDRAIKKYKSLVTHPMWEDHCGHGRNTFVRTYCGCDIHKYWPWHPKGPFTDDNAEYCVRYGNDCGDYYSSLKTLGDAMSAAANHGEHTHGHTHP